MISGPVVRRFKGVKAV
ncbi:MAG: hypothetical protein JCHSAcid_00990 [uncultured Acidilobus sp. JCHS]|jgi:hypothetical protein|nr:MAG: hypothetical protein MGAcid_01670 [uncultured Acidilobus sp. MG]ESQ26081.1 MAG: hypothetical protein OSP8Acid_03620 [uncultured Acidilobus sp. OSP8]ESQ26447.1 MAG: hypothetical protein JCHSAcid_00990 [uncultured Acidilobus sp. JCHS]